MDAVASKLCSLLPSVAPMAKRPHVRPARPSTIEALQQTISIDKLRDVFPSQVIENICRSGMSATTCENGCIHVSTQTHVAPQRLRLIGVAVAEEALDVHSRNVESVLQRVAVVSKHGLQNNSDDRAAIGKRA
eukprot:354470-Chlamydomonas_euryale.AAC.36